MNQVWMNPVSKFKISQIKWLNHYNNNHIINNNKIHLQQNKNKAFEHRWKLFKWNSYNSAKCTEFTDKKNAPSQTNHGFMNVYNNKLRF